ncbi:MAG: magnesium chelatase subunit H [Pseudomonadota bacterium]
MLDDRSINPAPYRVVIVTLDRHVAGPVARVQTRLQAAFPGLQVLVHAAAEWTESDAALEACKADIARADMILCTILFLEEQVQAILPALKARRDACDGFVGAVSSREIVSLTKLGGLDMTQPASGAMAFLKRLRGSAKPSAGSAQKQMRMLRRLPKLLRFIPGKAQDLRAYFLTMQYWLGGSDENIEALIRFLLSRYSRREEWRGITAAEPREYPECGVYHPDIEGRLVTDPDVLPTGTGPRIGLLLMRSYLLAGDTAHYDAVIRAFEARGMTVIPAFASGLDGRPALEAYHKGKIDAFVSLTGFSLVGGPAYNDSAAAEEALADLDVPYIAAHPLEFQTLGQWAQNATGLGPVETTMLIALPEIDGATTPTVFGGRHGPDGCAGCAHRCQAQGSNKAMAPCPERIEMLVARTQKLASLRRAQNAARKVGVVLYGFPPNAGAIGTAAYLGVFESLYNTLHALAADGYDLTPPDSVDALREAVLTGNKAKYGMPANVAARLSADDLVVRTPWLDEIEAVWGPAPGKVQSDGGGVFVLGAQFGNVFVGVQPSFGYEGDPMRLLFEKGFAPTHAFAAFYRYLSQDFGADVLLHFGMHGALEFMPGKQAGLSGACWPDRLIGDVPNVYLYAANNPSEGSLAKRRSNAVIVSHLTPPLAQSGLYKGLLDLKDTLNRYRAEGDASRRRELEKLIRDQAEAVDLDGSDVDALWTTLLETEGALIPDGLHVLGQPFSDATRAEYIDLMPQMEDDARAEVDAHLSRDTELPGILNALQGRYTRPAPGGDLIRGPAILPTGRNMHAFDPFRMPTAYAVEDGKRQAQTLLDTHASLPRTVALVLWGSDNIKTDGGPISQALALIGARPRFDGYGRLAGAELIPLDELGRPRIDVIMTLSGIFRDLLPLQTKLLAEAAYLAASADEPEAMNFVRANALAYAAAKDVDLETASLRVFSNAEGAYGSNVNLLIGSAAWEAEDELADAYEARKSFAYGRNGKCNANADLLQATLKTVDLAYQNLESVELGVTTVDHYFDTLGGISRAVKRAKGEDAPVYIGDQTRGGGKVRTLSDQIALETRSRALNPKWFEGLLKHGHEGVRQIEAQVTNTLGWSATTGQVDPWVYDRLSETFVLDDEMRKRMAALNPEASARMANRLLEAHERSYWNPDDETLEALRAGVDEFEDALEGIQVAAQ